MSSERPSSTAHEKLKDQEEIRERIQSAQTMGQLFAVIEEIDGIQGSKQYFSANSLRLDIKDAIVRGEEMDFSRITNGCGLRDKFRDLLAMEALRFNNFERALAAFHPAELSMIDFRDDLVERAYQEIKSPDSGEHIAIYLDRGLLGTIQSPHPGPFSSTKEFMEEVRRLLKSKGVSLEEHILMRG